jgi:hypothetical protein
MMNLLEFRERLRSFYGRHSYGVSLGAKFLACILVLYWINKTIGYYEPFNRMIIIVIGAIFAAFLPSIVAVLIAAVMILVHLNALSMEVMLSVALVFLILMLIHLIFSPEKLLVLILVPIAFYFKIPYVLPLILGLLGSFSSVIPMSGGVFIFFMLQYIKGNSALLMETGGLTKLQRFIQVINGVKDSQSLWFFIVAFAVVLVVVALLSALSLNHAREIALLTGSVMELAILLVGALYSEELMKEYSIVTIVIGTLISAGIAYLYQFMVLMLDYKRTEYIQFEDDEYQYYVKAVPKIAVTVSDRKLTTITARRNSRAEKHDHLDEGEQVDKTIEEDIHRNYADDF